MNKKKQMHNYLCTVCPLKFSFKELSILKRYVMFYKSAIHTVFVDYCTLKMHPSPLWIRPLYVPLPQCGRLKPRSGTRSFWTTGHSDHDVTRGVWRFASPRLRLGILTSLLSVSIGSQHIVWLVYSIQWDQWISSTIGSIRPNTGQCTTILTHLLFMDWTH